MHDASAVLFVATTGNGRAAGQLAVLTLATGDVKRLDLFGVTPHYVSTGHLVFKTEDGAVRAVGFDRMTLAVTGNPPPLVEGVDQFSVSDNGRLVYAFDAGDADTRRSLAWVERDGKEEPIAAPLREYTNPRIAPDGTRVALDLRDQENDIWLWDFPAGTLTRLTFHSRPDEYGHWTPDSERIVFSSFRDGRSNLYWIASDGTGVAQRLAPSQDPQRVNAVTPDGSTVIVRSTDPNRQSDLVAVPLDGDGVPETVLSTEFEERNAALSPGGTLLAYESDASGRNEIYLQPFNSDERWQRLISTAGGQEPLWSRDGRELFYRQAIGLMAVSIQTEPRLRVGTPQLLFLDDAYLSSTGSRAYDVAKDGRFLMISEQHGGRLEMAVVLNWAEELETRVPVN